MPEYMLRRTLQVRIANATQKIVVRYNVNSHLQSDQT